jgi:membrane protease YdiL (CAAX protease family)
LQNTEQDYPRHWGLPGTLLWGVFIAAAYVLVGIVAVGFYIGATQGAISPEAYPEAFLQTQFDGIAIGFSTITTALVCSLLVVLAVKSKRGSNLKEYLGLAMPSKRETGRWLLFFVAFIAVLDLVTYLLGKPIVPEFMWKVYSSTESRWILWIALILAAPLIEELFFRGFLIKGLAASPIGAIGAVVLTSAVWAVIHMQYEPYGIGSIFVMGLVLGTARIQTGSTSLAILMHALANLIATAETVVFLRYFGANN